LIQQFAITKQLRAIEARRFRLLTLEKLNDAHSICRLLQMSLRGSRSLSTSGQISDESAAANALHNRLPDAEPPGWQWSARSSDALDAEACAKNLHKWQKFIEKVRTHSLALTG
jgi:hypothetical protein